MHDSLPINNKDLINRQDNKERVFLHENCLAKCLT